MIRPYPFFSNMLFLLKHGLGNNDDLDRIIDPLAHHPKRLRNIRQGNSWVTRLLPRSHRGREPSRASSASLRMAQFRTLVRYPSQSMSWRFCLEVNQSLSCRWIMLHPFLVLDVLFDDFQRRPPTGKTSRSSSRAW